ncbi:MAG: hypothetical protein KAJ88_03470 [Candidatus Aenigmarchaeota archaeon]|nr:hypothetical protein [Candidatus Aenigmarchaeota archaeon]
MSYFCSLCKESISPEEYKYSMEKMGKALCRNHQKNFKEPNKTSTDENNGLSKKDNRYKESMIKGRIAETLIEELFLSLGYNVFRYGMENTVPGVMKLLKNIRCDVADNIRRMPDFVVQKNDQVHFVEVKFRANESFDINDNSLKNYPYENAIFILVSKRHIKCISYQELKAGKEITPKSKNFLGNRKEFDLDKNVIIDFCKFATKFFENV